MSAQRFPGAVIRFDLLLCALFAVPGLSVLVLGALSALNTGLGLPGALPPIHGGAHFFVNFAGLLGVLLNYILLHSRDRRAHWANVIARGGVIALILLYTAAHDLPWVFLSFVLTELGGALLTLPWLRQRD